ncbi:MAG TPA: prepilin-type N-terminal cleavage/methylation domain-containing protein [Candidatus Acidoferrales bacterium]|jgi:prepilin-type N-terminal cleavage/methylation domain-containing protein|nr:prepilin-type N-terminal cleavage/methylation domain-containing protein [Candidatus Acidoferrales bacterium]
MDQSLFSRKNIRGFTLTEVMVALFVLAVGLASVAALLGQTISGTSGTEYMTQAATLTSEKLEDLNRYPSDGAGGGDPNICVPSGTTAGSLTANTSASVACNNPTAVNVDYYDDVYFSPTAGSISETIYTGLNGSGNPQYTTTTQQPNGTVTVTQSTTSPGLQSGTIGFERRWIIELNPTINGTQINGVRRITVYVYLMNKSVAPNVSFQMSMVRP